DHAEVPAATTQPPEQIRVLNFADDDEFAVGGDHVARAQRVDRQPTLAHQMPDTAAEGEPAHTGMADDATGRGQPEYLASAIEVSTEAAALHPDGARRRIDPGAERWTPLIVR